MFDQVLSTALVWGEDDASKKDSERKRKSDIDKTKKIKIFDTAS